MYFTHLGYDDYPVVGVSWEQANAFCVVPSPENQQRIMSIIYDKVKAGKPVDLSPTCAVTLTQV